MNMAGNNMMKALDALSERDVYSLLLFALYRLRGVPEYATLSELAFVLKHDDLVRFLKVFAGATLKVPTMRDLETAIAGLLAYQAADLGGEPLASAIREASGALPQRDVREAYRAVKAAMAGFEPRGEGDE